MAAAVTVFRSSERGRCEERAFVLHAVGIESEIAWDGYCWQLAVLPEVEAAARAQLERYARENPPGPPEPAMDPLRGRAWPGVLSYVAVLLVVGFCASREFFDLSWSAAGRLDGALIRQGELWRPLTALTLHLDTGHLLSNLGFGAFFGYFAGRLLGSGVAWASILASGFAGNFLNAVLQSPQHRAVGASTAVFGALGLLAAYGWRRQSTRGRRWAQRSAPLIAGIALLAFLGTGDIRTDVVAHLTGFICGALLGAIYARLGVDIALEPRQQRRWGRVAILLLLSGWSIALWHAALDG